MMKKTLVCVLVCMLMITTTTTVIPQQTIRIDEKNLYKNTDGATGSFVNDSWIKTFGGLRVDASGSVVQTTDGGYILVGETVSYQSHGIDAWLIKTDPSGNKIWDKTFGGTNWDYGNFVQQTYDGGYVIIGGTQSYRAGSADAWLIKTDPNDDTIWDKTFGGTMKKNCNGAPRAEPVVPPLHTLLHQGFRGLYSDSEIRRSSNSSVHEVFHNILRIHPRAQPAVFCAGG